MNSFLSKMMSLSFKKAERRVKPLMYAQLIVVVGIVVGCFLVWNNNDNFLNNSAIMYLLIGTEFLLIGVENYIVREKQNKEYLIWCISALLFYWVAFDYYLFK